MLKLQFASELLHVVTSEIEDKTVNMDFNSEEIDDEALMELVGRGDSDACRVLVNRYLNQALSFSERMIGDRGDAEDLAQEAFLIVWTEAGRWKPKAKFTTWFRRVLYNLCIDYIRKSRPLVGGDLEVEITPDSTTNAEKSLISRETSNRVKDALQELPENQRAALILFHYEGLSQAETADVIQVSVSAVTSLLFRARTTLRETLKELNPNKRSRGGIV